MSVWPFEIVARTERSSRMLFVVPVLTVVLTVICATIMFTVTGNDAGTALYSIFVEPFLDAYGISEVLIKASPLIIIAQGLAIGFRARVWNIGAEGQLTIGAIFASLIPIYWVDQPFSLMLPSMIVAAGLGGVAWAAIAALLRTRFNASEIIVTLMLNQIAAQVLLYVINGPLKDPRGFSFPQSVSFPPEALYPLIVEGGLLRVNYSIILTLALSAVAWVFVAHSFSGYRLHVGGVAPAAARYAGFSANRAVWLSLLIGGACAGLAGVGEIAGPIGRLQPILSPGYGFAAIIVAFLGALTPIGIVLAGFFMAVIYVGTDGAVLSAGIPSSAPMVLQGLILVFYLMAYTLVNYQLRRKPGRMRA